MVNATAKTPSVKTLSRSLREPSRIRSSSRVRVTIDPVSSVSSARAAIVDDAGRANTPVRITPTTTVRNRKPNPASGPFGKSIRNAPATTTRKAAGMIRSCIRTCLMIAGSRSGMIRFLRTEYSQRIERSPPMQAIIPAKRARETGAPPLRPKSVFEDGAVQ